MTPRSNVPPRQERKQNDGRDGRIKIGGWEDSPFWKVRTWAPNAPDLQWLCQNDRSMHTMDLWCRF
ncbi:MAG: hypothetical protein VX199_04820 [Chloroflexota bacterium]|nr:hypothetical protein [Chloroflexota bacterium]